MSENLKTNATEASELQDQELDQVQGGLFSDKKAVTLPLNADNSESTKTINPSVLSEKPSKLQL